MSRSKNRRRGGGGRPPQHLGNVVTAGDARVIRTGEVIDLGDLSGPARQPLTASFVLFGTRYRVNPNLTELDVVDLLEQADNIDVTSPKAMIMVKDYARAHIHPDDFENFWKAARSNGYDTSGLMMLCWKLLEGVTGNPTGEQSDSSRGPLETKTSSPSPSPAPVGDLAERRAKREAYAWHLERLEAARGEDGKPIPVNAAIALQLMAQARSQGIDLEEEPSASATG